ncbi:large conductance mechanosensitive channel protein MscL [Sporosarcina sp. BI001-red]|uniref:large conductance mechanosensitive channel protein MscL n=1 Tax=Sporosarcina sp. BI001-red TaxID=2282866 RepID=UPI000E22CA0E|nr:large conductance mechanosensitive channel protein MscL [Sporosarcina sp. BI001-red]REB08185.1 large conductance mechanosensitive channel protein MscL [Sporosarcina sp. BI001-red]
MWKDFKEFAFKGNIFDLAIAVVIGAAFGKIVTSLVENIITPLIGLITGGIDLSSKAYSVPNTKSIIPYGAFIQSIIDFLIIAFSIFMVIRLLSKFKKKEVEQPAETPSIDAKEELLKEIRDLLQTQQAGVDETTSEDRHLPPNNPTE